MSQVSYWRRGWSAPRAQCLPWCSFLQSNLTATVRKSQLNVLRDASAMGLGVEGAEEVPVALLGKGFTLQGMPGSSPGEWGRMEISGRRESMQEELWRHMATGKLAESSLWTESRKCSVGRDEKRPQGQTGALQETQVPSQLLCTLPGHCWDYHYLWERHAPLLRCSDRTWRVQSAVGPEQITPEAHQPTFLYQERGALSLLNCWSKLLHRANIKLKHLFLKLQS